MDDSICLFYFSVPPGEPTGRGQPLQPEHRPATVLPLPGLSQAGQVPR